jgi:hypothetical protein
MTAQVRPIGGVYSEPVHVDNHIQELMDAVGKRAEAVGKTVVPILVSTNDALHAVLQTVKALGAQELNVGASERINPGQQLDQMALYWNILNGGQTAPLTIRIVTGNRDVWLDLAGGSRVPRAVERAARSIGDLRASGSGVDRVLLLHDGTQQSSDLFKSLLTMLDPHVIFEVVPTTIAKNDRLINDIEEARHLRREATTVALAPNAGFANELIRIIQKGGIDVTVARMSLATFHSGNGETISLWTDKVLQHTNCQILLAAESPDSI